MKKRWDKEIHFKRFSILLTNYLNLGFSIHRVATPKDYDGYLFHWLYSRRVKPSQISHINLWRCQIHFN